jgi:tetratricopeptide (TPR) repeat protein
LTTEGLLMERIQRYDAAIECFRRARDKAPGERSGYLTDAGLGHALAKSGQTTAARAEIDRLISLSKTTYVPPFAIATIYAGLNEDGKVLDILKSAVDQHNGGVLWLNADWRFAHLQSSPEFRTLLQRVGAKPLTNASQLTS